MTIPKAFSTVTPLSKTIAAILFILLPFLGFYVGIEYQKSLTLPPTLPSQQPSAITLSVTPNIPDQIDDIKAIKPRCGFAPTNQETNVSYKISSGMQTALCLDEVNPKLGSALRLKFFVQSRTGAPNATVTIELPQQVVLLEGELTWHGELQAGETHVQQLIIRIDELPEPMAIRSIDDYPKLAAIKAGAGSVLPDGGTFGSGRYLFLRASNDGTIETSENPFVTEPVTNQMRLRRLSPTPSLPSR